MARSFLLFLIIHISKFLIRLVPRDGRSNPTKAPTTTKINRKVFAVGDLEAQGPKICYPTGEIKIPTVRHSWDRTLNV